MINYRLQVIKIRESRKYNIGRYYNDPIRIKVNTFAEVINTIYEFESEIGVFIKVPVLMELTEDEEKAIKETRNRILRLNELEKELKKSKS